MALLTKLWSLKTGREIAVSVADAAVWKGRGWITTASGAGSTAGPFNSDYNLVPCFAPDGSAYERYAVDVRELTAMLGWTTRHSSEIDGTATYTN